MKLEQAQYLLSLNYESFDLFRLQKYYVELLDAWRASKAEYGFGQAIRDGFYKVIASESANGFSPTDIWLTHNLTQAINQVEELLENLNKKVGK